MGTATLITALAILSGFEKTLTNNVIGYTAHAEISSFGNHPLPDYPKTIDRLKRSSEHITAISPFVEQEAVLRSTNGIAGVVIQGVLPTDTMTLAFKKIIEGRAPTNDPKDSIPEIIVSKGSAKELQTAIGRNITVFRFIEGIQSREELLKNIARFKVVGVFETGMAEYDNNLAYTTLTAAQDLRKMAPLEVSGYRFLVDDLNKVKEICNELKLYLHYPYFVQSVYDIYPTIFGWIELQKKPIPIILGLIIIVAAFNVISTLLILVIEKTRQVGVLKSLGAADGSILSIFVSEGAYIAVLGIIFGNALAFILCWLQLHYHFFKLRSEIYFMSAVPISIEWQHYVIVSLIALAITITSALIPARIATKITPVNALKFG
ncbi:MAG TPA: FtsX-like permease family protein [Candidatus Kapabacteria bacterium]|nr:FtsX-like permease family protein [Candidatus Kapabacteria bacterium]